MIIGIIADDLTGAADSAAPFAALGMTAHVTWPNGNGNAACRPVARDNDDRHTRGPQSDGSPAVVLACDARAWTTETRDLPADRAEEIRKLVREMTFKLAASAPEIAFKKIDSTLRGWLALEVEAMRSELPARVALVCPAFVENGRTVRDGALCVHGSPVRRVREAFQMETNPAAVELSLAEIRDIGFFSRLQALAADSPGTLRSNATRTSGAPSPAQCRGRPGSVQTVFCDAETTDDLDRIARAIVAMPQSLLPVGSAGLAGALARAIAENSGRMPARKPAIESIAGGPVLVVVGSRNEVSRRQARRLAQRAGIEPIDWATDRTESALELRLSTAFEGGRQICLLQMPDETFSDRSAPAGWSLAKVLDAIPGLSVIVTGGATAMAIIAQDGSWSRIIVEGELSPGIVRGRLVGDATGSDMPIVLKAGGFGDDETLARCVRLMDQTIHCD
jgi:uncharacterized protein YgbK (DUF1537 family)